MDAESWGETNQATIEHFLGYSNRYSPTERIEDMVGGSYGFAEEDIDWLSIRWYLNDALTKGNMMSEYGEDNVKEALEMLKTMNAETFNADVKMDDWAWVAYYEYDFENMRWNKDSDEMERFRDYRKELYGVYLTTKEAKKAFNLLKGGVMGRGDWKDGTIATQVINGWKEIYKGSSVAKTIPVEIKFEYVPIRRFGYDTATHTKIRNAETSGQWEIGEQLEEAQMNAEEFDRGIQDKDGKIYSGEKDRIRKYFKNWEPKSYPYEKRIVSETKSKWCENCGELDEDDEDNWNYYQFFLKQKNSSRPTMRYLTGGYCNDCGSDLCQNCSDGQTSGQFNPLFEPNCDECGYSFCKSCKDEDEDRCNTCQEEYEENVCDCCGYLHHAESFEAQAPRGHKMMTAALGKKIPPMDSQEGMGDEAIVYAHYFNPYGMGEWWILEWDGKDEMFGYADLGFPELGYISLSELENVSIGSMELPIERDLHWREKTLGEVKQAVSKYRAESFSAMDDECETCTDPTDPTEDEWCGELCEECVYDGRTNCKLCCQTNPHRGAGGRLHWPWPPPPNTMAWDRAINYGFLDKDGKVIHDAESFSAPKEKGIDTIY